MQTVYATEIVLAAPGALHDIYALHQAVWAQVDRALAVRHRPTILYRRDGGMVRARIGDTAVLDGRGFPDKVAFAAGKTMEWHVRLGLWRRVQHLADSDAEDRIFDLMGQAGVELLSMRAQYAVSTGRKHSHAIDLPTADVQARIRVIDPTKAAHAWLNGIGRGRRFGLGMVVAA